MGQGNGRGHQSKSNDGHQRQIPQEHDAHHILQAFPILLAHADADHHAGHRQHAAGDGPEQTEEGVGSGKGGNAHAAHKAQGQHVDDQSADGLISVAQGAGNADFEDLSACFQTDAAQTKVQHGLAPEIVEELHAGKDPQAQRGGQSQTEGLHAQHRHKEVVQRQVGQDVGDACRGGQLVLVFQGKETGELLADDLGHDAHRHADEIAVKVGADGGIGSECAGEIEKACGKEGQRRHRGEKEGQQDIQRKDVLDAGELIFAHVFSADDLGAAHHHGVQRQEKGVERVVQADGAHGVGTHKVGCKQGGDDAVDRADHRQQHLDGQQAEAQALKHFEIRRWLVHKSPPLVLSTDVRCLSGDRMTSCVCLQHPGRGKKVSPRRKVYPERNKNPRLRKGAGGMVMR